MNLPSFLAAAVTAALLAPASSGQNLLANGDFEAGGLVGWSAFGNAHPASAAPPSVEPLSGTEVCLMYGNFSGGFDVSGIFQEFSASEGDSFTLDSWSRHYSGDPMIGAGPGSDNWVVQKIAFFDGGNNEIGGAEGTILDGTFATDTWHDNASVTGIAPAGTAKVQALILYLQPGNDGGASQIDDVEFIANTPPPPTNNLLTNGDFELGGLSGWGAFGNAFPESANPPAVDPLSGIEVCKMFGNFSGGFDVSGIFQEFAAAEGEIYTLDSWSRPFSGDPMIGAGPGSDNWVVQKIAFFDAGGAEIGGFEGTILDGSFATDTWHDNATVTGTAPAGTAKVQALILYLQPGNDGGAAQIDDVVFTQETPPPPPASNVLANPGFESGLENWTTFGNAFHEVAAPPAVVPQSGSGVLKMFGTFSGGFNVSGAFQTFGAAEGQTFTLDAASRHYSADPMLGAGPGADNWVVMKIAFFDAGGSEIAGAEEIILDGSSPTDTWIDNNAVSGTAPAGTRTVQALLLYLQPAFDGGAAYFDDVVFSVDGSCNGQGATWTNYGAGHPGTNGAPSLAMDTVPTIGQAVSIEMGNSAGSDAGSILFFGTQQTADPTPVGGTLWTNVVAIFPTTVPAAGGALGFNVPNNSALCGAEVYSQLFQIDAGASAGFSFSPGLRIIFGG